MMWTLMDILANTVEILDRLEPDEEEDGNEV